MKADVSPSRPESRPARRRLLDTATRLFYEAGIHAVGIDRIIAEAGVAKATFYNHFPSKDDLVVAYIEEQDRLGRAAVVTDSSSGSTISPRTKLPGWGGDLSLKFVFSFIVDT